MARENETGPNNPIDEQVDRLAKQLRDDGVAPERDLWGEIDQAIATTEQNQIRPRRVLHWDWPQIAATAAVIVVLVSAGWWGQQRGQSNGPPEITGQVAGRQATKPDESGLDMIDKALLELNQALAKDPDNRSLANLALMLHQSRGKVMRQQAGIRLASS